MQSKKFISKRSSAEQKEALVEFMEINLDFAHERFESINGVGLMRQKWDEFIKMLNALGGANKTSVQWKRYWLDLKKHLKKKHVEMCRKKQQSGVNGLGPVEDFTAIESRILSIMTKDSLEGDQITQEAGFASENENVFEVDFQESQQGEITTAQVAGSLMPPMPGQTDSGPSARSTAAAISRRQRLKRTNSDKYSELLKVEKPKVTALEAIAISIQNLADVVKTQTNRLKQ